MKRTFPVLTKMQAERKRVSDGNAFALISTLLIIAVLTIMVVAFMQSMRIDRLTARSFLNKQQADMAAHAGVVQAQTFLSGLMATEPYHAIGYVNNATGLAGGPSTQVTPIFLGNPDPNTAPTVRYLISTPTPTVAPIFNATNSVDLNKMSSRAGGWIGSPVVEGTMVNTAAKAMWINILKNPSLPNQPNKSQPNYNPVVSRYAYWIEDETAKLDYGVAGNANGVGGIFQRSTNTFDEDHFDLHLDVGALPMYSKQPLTTPDEPVINKRFVDTRNSTYRLPYDTGLINRLAYPTNSSINVWNDVRYHATPFSLSNELSGMGRRRINLNYLVTNVSPGDATAAGKVALDLYDIVYAISGKTLPASFTTGLNNATHTGMFLGRGAENGLLKDFGRRFYTNPALGTGATLKANHELTYLLRIAANIRDYIDTDSLPTLVTSAGVVSYNVVPAFAWTSGQEPVALGKEAMPNLQEHAWHAIVTEYTPQPNLGSVQNRVRISFTMDHYFEFYNSSTKDWLAPTGTFLRVYNRPDLSAGTASPAVELPDFTMDLSGINFPSGQAMVVTTCPNATDDPPGLLQSSNVARSTVPVGSRVFSGIIGNEPVGSGPTRYGLQMVQRNSTTSDYRTEMLFATPNGIVESHPFLAVTEDFSFSRASEVNDKSYFTLASNIRGNDAVSRSGDPRSVNEPLALNGGTNSAYGNDQARFFTSLGLGVSIPGSATFGVPGNPTYVSPTNWPDYSVALTSSANSAYAVIRDQSMDSIGELGNIYDPHRKLDSYSPVGIASARGGARSLRIGQPDDTISGTRFSAASMTSVGWFNAAWRLTDIFSVGDAADTMAPSTVEGKLNINGVMRDQGVAFRALLRKFQFLPSPNSDTGRAGKTMTDTEINNLLTSLKNYLQTNGPMMERGELSQLTFFNGAGTANTAGTQASSVTNDRGREEIFRRIVELITTRSSSFTVYCIGESVLQKSNGDIQRVAVSRQRVSFRLIPKIGNNVFDTASGFSLENYATSFE